MVGLSAGLPFIRRRQESMIPEDSRILIMGDIHCRVSRARDLLRKYEAEVDHTVFMGDYLDPYDEPNLATAEETANFVIEQLGREDTTLLFGNHDVHYMFEHGQSYQTSRYSRHEHQVWERLVGPCQDSLAIATSRGACLFTHAGLGWEMYQEVVGRYGLTKAKATAKELAGALETMWQEIRIHPAKTGTEPLLQAGPGRFGYAPYAGVLWADWSRELAVIPQVCQIVGHTRASQGVFRKSSPASTKSELAPVPDEQDLLTCHTPFPLAIPGNLLVDTSLDMAFLLDDRNAVIPVD